MKYYSLTFFLLLGFAVGCGSGQVPMRGTVVFSDDGSPLTTGTVVFSTPTFQAQGDLDRRGHFIMESYGAKDGLPPGTYHVFIRGAFIYVGGTTYDLIDPKHTGPATSGIEITVDRTTRNLDITVDRNPLPRPGGE